MTDTTLAFILIHKKIKAFQGDLLLKGQASHISVILQLMLRVELLLQRPQRREFSSYSHLQQNTVL
jgi:hypothetical protein